jgi:MFS family permease
MSSLSTAGFTAQQRLGMRCAILTQCFGMLGWLSFTSGLLLVYLTTLHVPPERIVMYLSAPAFALLALNLPFAAVADRYGKRRLAVFGTTGQALGFVVLALTGFAPAEWAERFILLGLVVFTVGLAMQNCGWFALLRPIVPEPYRGRYFGKLRFLWQLVAIFFFAGTGFVLAGSDHALKLIGWEATETNALRLYQMLLGAISVSMFIRIFFYARIPELEPPTRERTPFRQAVLECARRQGFLGYCSYLFLLLLSVGAAQSIFGLIEKKVLNFTDGQVVWLGTTTMVGSVFGFLAGGKATDRFGTKIVFCVCHLGYGALMFLFLFRGATPLPAIYVAGALHFLFGFTWAASSIAITTELLGMLPSGNQALAAALIETFQRGGQALSGALCAWILKIGVLRDEWSLWGQPLSQYDGLLLGYGILVIIAVVTLGLVPSVLHKAETLPQGAGTG